MDEFHQEINTPVTRVIKSVPPSFGLSLLLLPPHLRPIKIVLIAGDGAFNSELQLGERTELLSLLDP